MKPRDIFGLAVRLLGLFFLYLGLRAVSPILDLETLQTTGKADILNALIPIAFNLLVAWWLLGGGLLMRRAYPETSRMLSQFPSPPGPKSPAPGSVASQELTDQDRTEQKLAALVEKPKEEPTV